MRAGALTVVLWAGTVGCAPDPCAGQSGSCLSVELRGAGVRADLIRVDVFGAVQAGRDFSAAAGVYELPVQLGMLLPQAGGAITVQVAAQSQGQLVAVGKATATVPPGGESQVGIDLAAPGHDPCSDGYRAGDETDLDCGGAACGACADSRRCQADRDCQSLVCRGGRCASPSCGDGKKNGGEANVDCGGSACPGCADGVGCLVGTDCANGLCVGGKCVPGSCMDRVKNGQETDVDCGAMCAACGDGRKCTAATDCRSRVCTAGTCAAPACQDQVKNGDESDVDCGGKTCPPCAAGRGCVTGGDCGSGVCSAMMACAQPSCMDKVKNGAETDVDCGGGCLACGANAACAVAADCAARVCTAGRCAAPRCDDGVANGAESDVDCGGACPRCADGKACAAKDDCASGVCGVNKVCAAATCKDGVKNGRETDADCGGGMCPQCAPGRGCTVIGDCVGNHCLGGLCTLAFNPPISAPVGRGPGGIDVADLDGDFKKDLVVANGVDETVSVLLSHGDGTFNISTYPANAKQPLFVTAADVIGGEQPWIFVPRDEETDVVVLQNVGAGRFSRLINQLTMMPFDFPSDPKPTGATAADFTGDGRPDLVVASPVGALTIYSFQTLMMMQLQLSVYRVPDLGKTLRYSPWALAHGDLDGDGQADLAVTAKDNGGTLLVILNQGKATFSDPAPYKIGGFTGLAVGDFNGDKKDDVLITDAGTAMGYHDQVYVALAGAFDKPIATTVGKAPALPAVGDFDGDGKLDAVVPCGQTQTVSVLRGRGDGTFDPPIALVSGNGPTGAAVADFNGDGKPDIAVTDYDKWDVAVFLNALP